MLVLSAIVTVSFPQLLTRPVGFLRSNTFKLISCFDFVEFVSFGDKFFLKPGKVFT